MGSRTRWRNDASAVLSIYLVAIAVQCLHFSEEYVTAFRERSPRLFGDDWSDARFVTFNMLWLATFVLAGLGVYRRVQLAYLVVLFLALSLPGAARLRAKDSTASVSK